MPVMNAVVLRTPPSPGQQVLNQQTVGDATSRSVLVEVSLCVGDIAMSGEPVGDIETGCAGQHVGCHGRTGTRRIHEDRRGGTVQCQRQYDLVEYELASSGVVATWSIVEAAQVAVDAPLQGIDTGGRQGLTLTACLKLTTVLDLKDVATVRTAEQVGAPEVFDIRKEIEFGSQ